MSGMVIGINVSIAFRLCLPFRRTHGIATVHGKHVQSQSPFGFACLSDLKAWRLKPLYIISLNRLSALPAFPTFSQKARTKDKTPHVSIAFRLCLPFRLIATAGQGYGGDLSQSPFGFACLSDYNSRRERSEVSNSLNRLSALPAFPTPNVWMGGDSAGIVSIAFRLCLPFRPGSD